MDFQKDILPVLPQIVLGITVLVIFLNYRRHPGYFKAFSYFWLFVFLTEIAGHQLGRRGIHNLWLYNISLLITFLFLPWFFSRFPSAAPLRRLLRWYYIFFGFILLAEIFFGHPTRELLSTMVVAGGLAIIAIAAWYLWQLYQSEDEKSIQSDPHFWLSVGFLLVYAATTPYLGMLNYLWDHYPAFTGVYHVVVTYGFNILLNIFICIAFLCRTTDFQK